MKRIIPLPLPSCFFPLANLSSPLFIYGSGEVQNAEPAKTPGVPSCLPLPYHDSSAIYPKGHSIWEMPLQGRRYAAALPFLFKARLQEGAVSPDSFQKLNVSLRRRPQEPFKHEVDASQDGYHKA